MRQIGEGLFLVESGLLVFWRTVSFVGNDAGSSGNDAGAPGGAARFSSDVQLFFLAAFHGDRRNQLCGLERKLQLKVDAAIRSIGRIRTAGERIRLSKNGRTEIADDPANVDVVEDIARIDAEGQVVTAVR